MAPAQKRKKTAEMPDSPPKRVTRARAKASDEPASKAKTVKVMTPSTKAASNKGKLETKKAAKTKTRSDGEQQVEPVKEQIEEQPVKTRGRARKTEEKATEPTVMDAAPKKTRGRQTKAIEADQTKMTGPKTRGRPQNGESPSDSKLPALSESKKLEAIKPTTRARATTTKQTEMVKAPAKSANTKPAAIKKKVTFQDEPHKNKENIPIEAEKSTAKATGLRAKPIRKPAAARATGREKNAPPVKTPSETHVPKDKVQPLSPKKVVQVAKSSSISSEDELSGSKTPIRNVSRSPIKPPPSSARLINAPVSKLDLSTTSAPSSPTKSVTSIALQSPARRPPPSPFKDAMKSSPRKIDLGEATPRPALLFPQSSLKSTMKDSPRRGFAPVSLAQPVFLSKSPMKTSLLQSPARRPGGSPMKAPVLQSPTKSNGKKPSALKTAPSKPEGPADELNPPQEEAISSGLRTMRDQGSPIKVHEVIEADRTTTANTVNAKSTHQENPDVLDGDGTLPLTLSRDPGSETDARQHENQFDDDGARSPTPSPTKSDRQMDSMQNFAEKYVTKESDNEGPDHRSTTPPDPVPFAASAFSLASPAFRCAADESDSEDELASPRKAFQKAPLKPQSISTQDLGIPVTGTSAASRRSSLRAGAKKQSLGMTPLAVQMSTWLASSPEKKDLSESAQIGQPVLSPVKLTYEESPPKPSFFDEQMTLCDASNDTVFDVEMAEAETGQVAAETSQESQSFEEYGDENAVPVDPQLAAMSQVPRDQPTTCTPAKVFYAQPREIHTVSKVPLRPAGDESPIKLPRKRSRSMAGPLASGNALRVVSAPAIVVESTDDQNHTPVKRPEGKKPTSPVKPRSSNDDSLIGTPRTIRKEGSSSVLRGAVVYVDVHTSEGEDASGIFLELLAQMGARCVKQWSWNPRHSIVGGDDSLSQHEASTSKIGISHVVFKDGGKRTMEKVRDSKGAVACVGVGWVLE